MCQKGSRAWTPRPPASTKPDRVSLQAVGVRVAPEGRMLGSVWSGVDGTAGDPRALTFPRCPPGSVLALSLRARREGAELRATGSGSNLCTPLLTPVNTHPGGSWTPSPTGSAREKELQETGRRWGVLPASKSHLNSFSSYKSLPASTGLQSQIQNLA